MRPADQACFVRDRSAVTANASPLYADSETTSHCTTSHDDFVTSVPAVKTNAFPLYVYSEDKSHACGVANSLTVTANPLEADSGAVATVSHNDSTTEGAGRHRARPNRHDDHDDVNDHNDTQGGNPESKHEEFEIVDDESPTYLPDVIDRVCDDKDVESQNVQIIKLIAALGNKDSGRRAILKAMALKQGMFSDEDVDALINGSSERRLQVPAYLREVLRDIGLGETLAPMNLFEILAANEPLLMAFSSIALMRESRWLVMLGCRHLAMNGLEI